MKKPNPELPTSVRDILFEDSRFIRGSGSVTLGLVVILVMNLFHIGGNNFIFGFNSFSAFVISTIAAAYAARIRLKMQWERLSDLAWLSISVGFGLWAVAEAFRLTYMVIFQYPPFLAMSWFWLLGYPPFFYGVYQRLQDIEDSPSSGQRRLLWGIGGLGLLFIIGAEIIPAIFFGANIFPALLYTLLDLVLLIGITRITQAYEGVFAGPWRFFVIGLAAKTIGEVVWLFPGQFGTENPGFLLSITNFAHYSWCAFAVLGMFVYDTVLRRGTITTSAFPTAQTPKIKEEKIPNASALVFTDKDDMVIRASLNFRYLLHLPDEIGASGLSLRELLGISENAYDEYKTLLLKQGQVTKFVVQPVYLRQGQKAWLTTAISYDAQKKYNGGDVVVQVMAEGVGGAALISEERAVAENIFWRTGSQGEDNFKLLVDYFNINYKMLSTLASEYEGSKRAAGLSEVVNRAASKQKIPVNVLEQQIMLKTTVKLEELVPAVAVLLNAARAYVSKLAGPEIVRQETEKINREADLSTKKLIERFNLAQ